MGGRMATRSIIALQPSREERNLLECGRFWNPLLTKRATGEMSCGKERTLDSSDSEHNPSGESTLLQ